MRGHRLHCTGCLSPEGETKECRLSRHECQAAVEVTPWKGQQANQGYPISNNLQLQRNARHSAAADWPEAAVTWPFDPLQLCEGAITWCLTSLKEWVPVRGAEQEGRRKSESSNINRVPQTKTHDFSFSVCSGLLSFFLFFSNVVSLFTPGERWGLDSRSVTEELSGGQRKNKTLLGVETAAGHVVGRPRLCWVNFLLIAVQRGC